MRPLATVVASLAMALAALGMAVAAPGGGGERALAELQAASGVVRITNSREGRAVFNAAGVGPGAGVDGTVRIGNRGSARGRFSVRPSGLRDIPGPGGVRLSGAVQMGVFDVTDRRRPRTVYSGPVAAFRTVAVGEIAPGAHRDFLVAATLPVTADNRLQGAGLSLGFEWRAVPVPVPRPRPVAPRPAVTPPPLDHSSCLKRRRVRIRLRVPGGARVESVMVQINGRVKARVNGGRRSVRVKLRGATRRFTVRVTIDASDGKRYKRTRRYRLCHR